VEGQPTSTEAERSHPLLGAITDLRDALDRLIEEQKSLVLRYGTELTAAVPPISSPSLVALPEIEPEPPPTRKSAPSGSRPRPAAPSRAPFVEPVEPVANEPARPEDARQRLDALAAKLLDRRLRQTSADSSPHQHEG
jgi:hypothetical protein